MGTVATSRGSSRPRDPWERRARAAVLDLARTEVRRVHPTLLRVGDPCGAVDVVPEDAAWDHALRTDLLAALLWRRGPDPLVWVTRTGGLAWQDVDQRWYAAFLAARGETGLDAQLLVVTRHGWHDPATGTTRTWRRIRDRRSGPAT
ncbi:hypothetical protein [Nocardioides sp.]|uniref:hypothetical protein n=1 Tax=Nocardioides sp. TaxID=35761 RepID=UPI00262959C1|nr:hypothetical protein [Nocardioides sp.]